jgi:hypothetical protein
MLCVIRHFGSAEASPAVRSFDLDLLLGKEESDQNKKREQQHNI